MNKIAELELELTDTFTQDDFEFEPDFDPADDLLAVENPSEYQQLMPLLEHPILTREQETVLFALYKKKVPVSYLKDPLGFPLPIENDRQAELLNNVINRSNSIQDVIMLCNQRLVYKIVQKYSGKNHSAAFGLLDKMNEGNIGLMIAIPKFDIASDNKFATYAYHWVRQSVTRAVADKSRAIRFPAHFFGTFYKAANIIKDFELRNGQLTDPEIRRRILKANGFDDNETKNINEVWITTAEMVSLDLPIGDENATLGDFISDSNSKNNLESIGLNIDKAATFKVAKSYLYQRTGSDRGWDVLVLRYGLNGDEPKTLREIASRFGVTHERIRQIEHYSLRILKANPKLRNYFLES